jgi:glycosyltransferase involved in cell wall biosynthesis
MKNSLLICRVYPLPENLGTSIRTMNFVRFFQNYGTVDIAYSYQSTREQVANSPFSNEFLLNNASTSFEKRLINGFIKGVPVPVHDFHNASKRLLLAHIRANDYDYIFVRYIANTGILFKLETKYRARSIIDFDDILSGSLYDTKFGSVKGTLKKIILALNRQRLRYYEKKCLNFGASLFCSGRDSARLTAKHQKARSFVVPNIYANESFKDYDFEDGFKKANILLFVGTLNYRPNIHGLEWFIESVFPSFKKEYPDAKLLVVGLCPTDAIKKLCEAGDGIELYSDVPDIKEYYRQCRALVVPLLSGSGTRIKILEAALANTPVLSTPTGAEGLELVDGTDLLLFGTARDFCTKYSRLLNRDKYNSLTRNARKAVQSHYSTQRFNHVMAQVLRKIEYKQCNMISK